ncbi:MFS transporter [Peterkaempfera sp. SMS 1(5)a]|uniref:MFS transporter n=1 Tax=Peterkaempfera podocarpi TaxID=3232308 RepID=UPI0036720C35
MTPEQPERPSPARLRALARKVRPDLSPWHSSRDFRLLWSAGLITTFGSFLTYVAVPLQIKEITGSSLAVGLLGAVELVPMVVCGLWGGALADSMDRRRLVLASEAGLGVLSVLLLVNALLPRPLLWPIYAVIALLAALDGLQRPSLDALTPRIVGHDQLTAAAALISLRWQIGAIVGPSLAGVIAATAGVQVAYALDVATFAVSLVLLSRLRAVPPPTGAERPSLRAVAEGLRYAWSRKELLGTYAVDIVAMLFAFPNAVFPFLADRLDAPWALGLMYAASSVGSLAVSATSGWASHIHRHGRMVIIAAGLWGAAVTGAGLAGNIWLVLLFLALAGGADMVSGLGRTTLWNQSIPDALRGRLAGVELLSYSLGPQLGQVRAGGMAAVFGVRASIWSGGLLCVAGVGALVAALPRLLAYDSRTDPHVAAARAERERTEPERTERERAERERAEQERATAGDRPVREPAP